LYRTELQSAADASALAGVISLSKGLGSASANDAIDYDHRNKVGDSTNTLAAADIQPGNWSSAGVFTNRDWLDSDANAVKVVTRYPGSFTFGRLAGLTTKNLTATAIAVHGSVGKDRCIRPWAVPYILMIQSLHPTWPADSVVHNLTPAEVLQLSQNTQANFTSLKIGDNTSGVVSGNFYGVTLPPILYANGTTGTPWSGGNDYRNAIGESCAALAAQMGSNPNVGVGDWLAPENGNMIGPTKQGIQDLCHLTGSNYTCSSPVRIIVAMWDQSGNAPGVSGCGGKCFRVKALGVFYVMRYNTGSDAVEGYFQTLSEVGGGFVPAPGAIEMNALVR